jgi:hypothetical protein
MFHGVLILGFDSWLSGDLLTIFAIVFVAFHMLCLFGFDGYSSISIFELIL